MDDPATSCLALERRRLTLRDQLNMWKERLDLTNGGVEAKLCDVIKRGGDQHLKFVKEGLDILRDSWMGDQEWFWDQHKEKILRGLEADLRRLDERSGGGASADGPAPCQAPRQEVPDLVIQQPLVSVPQCAPAGKHQPAEVNIAPPPKNSVVQTVSAEIFNKYESAQS